MGLIFGNEGKARMYIPGGQDILYVRDYRCG